jgi:hypothetical protein
MKSKPTSRYHHVAIWPEYRDAIVASDDTDAALREPDRGDIAPPDI